MKKVVVISASLRANSNSDALAQQFVKGAQEAGNEVEYISLRGKKLGFCIGCMACQKTGKCFMDDDANAIADQVLNADVVAWATPIYYYEMSGQMKTLIDRMNSMYPKNYKFRDIYLMTTAADDDAATPRRALAGLQGWVDCFENVAIKGSVFCGGVDAPGEIAGNQQLRAAYEMGKSV